MTDESLRDQAAQKAPLVRTGWRKLSTSGDECTIQHPHSDAALGKVSDRWRSLPDFEASTVKK